MAYVGTPSYLGSDVYTLASILQGESSTTAGQQAVASVMANRLNAGGFVTNGNYSGILGIALGANQFQGQSTPSQGALNIAQQALDGSLSDNTYGALYYGAPAAGNASWLNRLLSSGTGLTIGGNTFSDQQGPASAAYQNAVSNGAASGASEFDTGDASMFDSNSLMGAPGSTGTNYGYPAIAGGTGLINPGSIPTAQAAGTPTATSTGLLISGQPVDITNLNTLNKAVTQAGSSIQSGAQNAATGVAGTIASTINSIEQYTNEAFVVTALVVLGLIMVAYGLGIFKTMKIPIPV